MATTLLQQIAKVESNNRVKLIAKSATPEKDGYEITLQSGLPFHVHPEATPEIWSLVESAIKSNKATIVVFTPPPAPSPEEIVLSYQSVLQLELDGLAKDWGYDSIISAASYVSSSVPKFKAESAALIEWRDEVWTWAEQQKAQITSSQTTISNEAIVAAMPAKPLRPVV